jgi:TetR/AcrR family transcriptional repressor of nem operon
MRVSRQKAAENRERIIEAAGALFCEKGFDRVGVADIMKAADLTHGGFYGHFESKDDLTAQASERAMARAATNWGKIVAEAPNNSYAALLKHYLSQGCAFAALSGDAARCGKPVRTAFAEGLERLIEIVEKTVPSRSKTVRRRRAVAAVAELVGALILSRAVEDLSLSDEILDSARHELLAAAGR